MPKGYVVITEDVKDPAGMGEYAKLASKAMAGATILAFGRGIHSCPGAPLARAETRVGLERLLDRTTDIRISEAHHGPAGSRRYQYIPTYILRGLTELHLEFDLVEGAT